MIDIVKDRCVGCSACKSKCPKNCIDLKPNGEGFLYPQIDYNKCVKCGLCDKVCPVLRKKDNGSNYEIKTYAVKHKDESIRLNSSSGGAFSLFAKYVLEKQGVVFGAAFSESFKVKHDFIENVGDLNKFQGSKYVQSDIGDNYVKAERFLQKGRLVLFPGTPCQVAGVKAYLGKDYENLITVDFACHGVPSPLVWEKYLNFLQKQYGAKIKDAKFRNKTYGWDDFALSVSFSTGERLCESHKTNDMMKVFLKNYCLRSACYNCQFKGIKGDSDITLCDFWGVKESYPELYDKSGVSLIMINGLRGEDLFDKVKNLAYVQKVDTDKGIKYNSAIVKSVMRPVERDIFIKQIKSKSFGDAIRITEKKADKATKIKIFKEDIDAIKKEKGKTYAMLYYLKHFWKVYF